VDSLHFLLVMPFKHLWDGLLVRTVARDQSDEAADSTRPMRDRDLMIVSQETNVGALKQVD
jgi:hypothetical protein